jgi:hypothetical protein
MAARGGDLGPAVSEASLDERLVKSELSVRTTGCRGNDLSLDGRSASDVVDDGVA